MGVCNTILYAIDYDDDYSKDNNFNEDHAHIFGNGADIDINTNIGDNVGYEVNKTIDKTTSVLMFDQ